MSEFFSASEVIQFAIRIEQNGEEFYRLVAKNIQEKKIGDTFNLLADEEAKHRRIFEEMVAKVESYQPQESYPGEYFSFLKGYADEHIFTQEKKGRLLAKKIKSAKEAVEFALSIEIDSILYYLEAKNLVPENQRTTLDKVVDEERRHYLKLLQVKKTL